MKKRYTLAAVSIAIFTVLDVHAAEPAKPVRMGSGVMTFETVAGWGLLPDGTSAWGRRMGRS